MTNLDTQDVRSRTLVALFDTREAADRAVRDLEAAGIPRQHITRSDGGATSGAGMAGGTGTAGTGLWEELKSLFVPEEDRYAYSEGVRRGGFLVSVRVEEAYYNQAMDILDADGAVDLDTREATWRSEGWTGYQAGGTSGAAGSLAGAAVGATAVSATTADRRTAAGTDETIPIYEEKINVGKRDVSHGRVRLRSYVVETPVSEQVSLREERVSVERRPVDRAAEGLTGDVFRERTIEVEERAEEAVIGKEIRVKEEISLSKQAESRTQTISDTVRRTEVEVEDERGLKVGAAATGSTSFASRIAEHMDVIGSDGTKIGTVDHLEGTTGIKLTRTSSPDGQHHVIPLAWVDHVDSHVHLNQTAAAAKAGW